jgi:hypothetical protein
MTQEALRRELSIAFEYCYRHEEWVYPLEKALDNLSAAEALVQTPGGGMSIWQIVLHTANFNENMVRRIETGEKSPPPEGSWPALPAIRDDAAWNQAKDRLRVSIDDLHHVIQSAPFEKILNSPYGLADLLCRYIHIGYHLGQITKMREWLDPRDKPSLG